MPRIDEIEKLLASSPDDVFLNFALAMELVKAGQDDQAAVRFERVIQLDPNYITGYRQWSHMLVTLGRKDEAKAVLARGIEAATRAGDKHAVSKMQEAISLLG
jgi:predicted Zn-dependent protease